jgi:hypothetical protein
MGPSGVLMLMLLKVSLNSLLAHAAQPASWLPVINARRGRESEGEKKNSP